MRAGIYNPPQGEDSHAMYARAVATFNALAARHSGRRGGLARFELCRRDVRALARHRRGLALRTDRFRWGSVAQRADARSAVPPLPRARWVLAVTAIGAGLAGRARRRRAESSMASRGQ